MTKLDGCYSFVWFCMSHERWCLMCLMFSVKSNLNL